MKKIQYRYTAQIQIETTPTNLTEAMRLVLEAHGNRAKIIEGALTVEAQLDAVISNYFFSGGDPVRKHEFELAVLRSDWCSFAAKRKLLEHVITARRLLEGKEKSAFEKAMRKVMAHRNAFAHGTFSWAANAVWLSFFEGTPRKLELSDNYLEEIERDMNLGFELAFKLAVKSGAANVSVLDNALGGMERPQSKSDASSSESPS